MSVLMSEIVNNLVKYNPAFRVKHNSYVRCCKFLNNNDLPLNSKDIYLASISNLPSNISSNKIVNLLLLTNKDVPNYLKDNPMVNYIAINQDISKTKIFNELQDLFFHNEYKTNCAEKLFDALNKERDVQQILNICAEILGNPVLLADSFLYLINYSGFDDSIDEPVWKNYITTGHIPLEYINQQNLNLTVQNSIAPDIMWNTSTLKHKQIIGRIRLNNTLIAYLKILEYNRKITKSDIMIIPIICNTLALAVEKSKYSFFIPESPIETLMIHLLKGDMISEISIEEIQNQFIANQYTTYYILSFYVKTDISDLTVKLCHVKGLINSIFHHYHTVIYNDHIVTLVTKKSPKEPIIDSYLHNAFIKLLSDNQVVAGVSRCFHNIMEIFKFHIQSIKAAKLGYKLNKKDNLYLYNDYAVYHLFEACSFKEKLEEFCDPSILKLINDDKENGTSYALSLYTYIQNNFDIQKTSYFMNVHYNTIKYRLQKIEDALEIDLKDSNVVFHISLSFRILGFLGYFKL
ncbi:PucR family transcriptional regulator [Clostridium coskatii]|uniref:PucR C-terminal helix-turn-helix domain-containing protein n=1 Tax=Clostridium coskatii TaxID=1705578 RepID=A0A162NAU9_9CLOT|nr:helix-turn-helix domain-containing protein [Clostridium coskatii]OAA91149.1 hypothetical protein WX73_01840 [Clostridium coskatii]OBR90576.1 hypothetical protein CLCOS_39410 [Clostridium coskatii]